MAAPEFRRLTAKMAILGVLLVAIVLLATPAHAAVAAEGGPEACWNLCTLLQIVFPRLMCIQACF
jgi:hypothetical protein